MDDRLLTEIERQRKYLNRLPSDFTYPLFNAKQAIQSQRASGYRDTASAGREIVDNAIEAGAHQIHIVLDTEKEGNLKGSVRAVAFIDDGPGMLPQMARYAMSWGGGSHFDDPSFIGRFGFGLPNASINQTKTTAVYTRTDGQNGFTKVWLNIDDYNEYGMQTIHEPEEDVELPKFVQSYLSRNHITLNHGTVVVWDKPDRLSFRKVASLKEHLINDFGVTYRYLLATDKRDRLNDFELIIEGTRVSPVDPLFLLPEGRYYLPEEDGGAHLAYEHSIPVKYVRNHESGERHLRRVEELSEIDRSDDEAIAFGIILVKVSRFPHNFIQGRNVKDKDITDANRRFEIRKTRRGMSFVRAGREIQTFDAFPRKSKDEGEGLGSWPALLAYAYHWGIQIDFQPELDDVFGITNDKQSVRPTEDFWRILAEENIDDVLRAQQSKLQDEADMRRRIQLDISTISLRPTRAEEAARDADAAEGRPPQIPQYERDTVRDRFDARVSKEAERTQKPLEEVRQALLAEAKRKPYQIVYEDSKHGPFYEPEWGDPGQIHVKLNRSHPFYAEIYSKIVSLNGGDEIKDGIDILLLTLARAELTSEDKDMRDWYEAQREDRWSPYLKRAIKNLQQRRQHGTTTEGQNESLDENGEVVI